LPIGSSAWEDHWDDLDDYITFFVSNSAPLLDLEDPLLRDNLVHDLRDGRVRLSPDALVGDVADTFFDPNPWESVQVPIRFLHAQWGVGTYGMPAYPDDLVMSRTQSRRGHSADSIMLARS
jgi:hypothetical protein